MWCPEWSHFHYCCAFSSNSIRGGVLFPINSAGGGNPIRAKVKVFKTDTKFLQNVVHCTVATNELLCHKNAGALMGLIGLLAGRS